MPRFFNLLKNKKLCFALLAIVFIGITTPIYYANAIDPVTIILGAVSGLIGGIIGTAASFGIYIGIIVLIFSVCAFVLGKADFILAWALTGPFKIAMTNPNNNIIIQLGWTLTRDFTNMLFILGLAYIGLATALDIANFDTKKTFINLILIALLINFTPVICGVIVDVANLVTNFFIQDVDFSIMQKAANKAISLSGGLSDLVSFSKERLAGLIFDILTVSAFSFFSGLTLLVFGGLFLLRPVVIWILVILSPLAFFAWIFDKSKKYFDMWWKNFIGWAFVSVPASFFLYLAFAMSKEAENNGLINLATQGGASQATAEIAAPLIITAFMAFSFYATKTLTPVGASAVIGWVGKQKGKALDLAKKYGWKGAKGIYRTPRSGAVGAIRGVQRAAQEGKGGLAQFGAGMLGGVAAINTPGGRKAAHIDTKRFVGGIREKIPVPLIGKTPGKTAQEIDKMMKYGEVEKNFENVESDKLKKIVAQSPYLRDPAQFAVAVKKLIKEGDFDFAGDQAKSIIQEMQSQHKGVDISGLGKQAPELQQYLKTKDFATDVRAKAPGATMGTPAWNNAAQEVNEEWAQRHYKDLETMSAQQRSEMTRKIRKESLNHLIMSLKDNELDSMGDWLSTSQRKHMRGLVTPGSTTLRDLYAQETTLRDTGQIARADRLSDAILEAQTNAKFTV